MKKIIFTLFVSLFLINEVSAAPGDTTWVTIYNARKITQYGNYDTSAVFPTGKTYRKIRLHYILGRYACSAGETYCGSWDYTTHVYAKPVGADTVELARIITPYATDWLSTNRKHDYIVEVTDYASILQGNLDLRYIYDGYSWGFTVTLKLEMIEGTPPMTATSVKNVYDGYFAYGRTTDPIESHLIPKAFQYTSPNTTAFLKNIISGHGSDDNGCGEFCSKYYELKINNVSVSQKQLWRSDCGLNNIYPQTGTWVYERANWCPGNIVNPIMHDLSSLTSPASTFSVDLDMEAYTSPTPSNAGGFNIVSQLITYKAPNFSTDVSIEDIIAPSNDPNYARANNVCSNPVIKIKNTGTTPVTQVIFDYYLTGGSVYHYTWTGSLNFLDEAIVDFGPSLDMFAWNNSNIFNVAISKVNGASGDQNAFNNTYSSTYNAVKSYPTKFVVYYKTNVSTSISTGFNEAGWTLTDQAGNNVASRINNQNNTIYRDTLSLPSGCYTFKMDDDGCDGISWWANTAGGTGTLRFSSATTPASLKTFSGDFGCQVIERFTVGYVLSVEDKNAADSKIQLYPNPASQAVNLLFDVKEFQDVTYSVTDVTGKELLNGQFDHISSEVYPVNTSELGSGIYFIKCHFSKGGTIIQKFIISK